MPTSTNVLIVGAGPTGLVLALCLATLGIAVRLIDKNPSPGTTSRALGVQARTLELYRRLGLADSVAAAGHPAPAVNLWVGGARRAHLAFGPALAALTSYPFLLLLPQDQHERLLLERLATLGVTVERGTQLTRFTQDDDGVRATLRRPDGSDQVCAARYLAGCDGAHSTVRDGLRIGFTGGTYERLFYVADIVAGGAALDGDVHLQLGAVADFLVLLPLAGAGRARLVGTLADPGAARQAALTFDDVDRQALHRLRIDVRQVDWFSTYRVQHRVAEHLRAQHAFLLGDAGHIHSPAGGQGMNTGIGDAVNLAWKLAAVLRRQAGPALLDSYELERIGFARQLVASTDRVFTLATSARPLALVARTTIAPLLLAIASRLAPVRRRLLRTVSQLALHYRASPLSAGRAGRLCGGDRLPWLKAAGTGNHPPTAGLAWQVHVVGAASAALLAWCADAGIALTVSPWSAAARRAGFGRDAAYLIRPDGYVALAAPTAAPQRFAHYLARHGISPGSDHDCLQLVRAQVANNRGLTPGWFSGPR